MGETATLAQLRARAVAVLTRVPGDIGSAEDAVSEAFAVALQRWPAQVALTLRLLGGLSRPEIARPAGTPRATSPGHGPDAPRFDGVDDCWTTHGPAGRPHSEERFESER